MKKIIYTILITVFCLTLSVSGGTNLNDIVAARNTAMVLEGENLSEIIGQTGSYGNITALVVDNDGTIIIGNDGGVIARLNKDLTGQLDWGPNLGGAVTSLAVQSTGIIIAGVAKTNGSYVRLSGDFEILETKTNLGDAFDAVYVAVLSDDRVVAVGEMNGRIWLAPAEPNIPAAMPSDLYSDAKPVTSLAVQSDDTVIVGSQGLSGSAGWLWKLAVSGDTLVRGAEQRYFGQGRIFVGVLSNDDIVVGSQTSGVIYVRDGSDLSSRFTGTITNEDIQGIAVTGDDKVIVSSNANSGSVKLYENTGSALSLVATATDLESNMKVATWLPRLDSCEDYWLAGIGNPADINMDCKVDEDDLKMFATSWLTTYDKDSF